MKLQIILNQELKAKIFLLEDYVTTDNLLQNKQGKTTAKNLPPQSCSLIAYHQNDILIGNIRPYLQKIWFADSNGGNSANVLTLTVIKNQILTYDIPEFPIEQENQIASVLSILDKKISINQQVNDNLGER